MTDVKVEQCDRDAAAGTIPDDGSHTSHMMFDGIINGRADGWPLVQAFARHRQVAEKAQQEREMDLAEAARIMFEATRDRFMRPEQCYPAITALHEAGFLRDPATAIRSQGHE